MTFLFPKLTVFLGTLGNKNWYISKNKNPKGNQSWIFIGRTDAEAEALILGPPDVKSCFTGKDPDAGKDWRQDKGVTEDEMVGWHHQLNGHESEQSLGDAEGQGSLECCSPWGHKESDTTEQLNWTDVWERMYILSFFRGLPIHVNRLKFTHPKALTALRVQPHCSQKCFPNTLVTNQGRDRRMRTSQGITHHMPRADPSHVETKPAPAQPMRVYGIYL